MTNEKLATIWPEFYAKGQIKITGRTLAEYEDDKRRHNTEAKRAHAAKALAYYYEKKKKIS